jgi:hypothetical protein
MLLAGGGCARNGNTVAGFAAFAGLLHRWSAGNHMYISACVPQITIASRDKERVGKPANPANPAKCDFGMQH